MQCDIHIFCSFRIYLKTRHSFLSIGDWSAELEFHVPSLGDTVNMEDLWMVLFFLSFSVLTVLPLWPLTPPLGSSDQNTYGVNPTMGCRCRSSTTEFSVTTLADVRPTFVCSSCFLPGVRERLLHFHFQLQHFLFHQDQRTTLTPWLVFLNQHYVSFLLRRR